MATILLFWPAFCILFALMQGLLMPAIRRTPPGTEANRQAFALHWVGTIAYFLPVWLNPSLLAIGVAFAARVLLFDVVLNLGAGRPAFEVGQTAAWDKLLRRLAPKHPERLSAGIRIAAALLAAAAVTLAVV